MITRSVGELVQILCGSENEAWRDDAAQELAHAPNRDEAEVALLEAIESPTLDDSLLRTCAESLATIWIERGAVEQRAFARLTGMPRQVVEAFLLAAHVPFEGK